MMPPASDPYVRALSRSQDRLTSIPVNPNEIQNANLLSRLPGPNDVAGSPISSQSLSAERQDGLDLVVHRITNFLAGLYELPSPSSTWLHLKLSPIERDEVLQCLENNSTFACCR